MADKRLALTLREMTVEDIDQVITIDRLGFSTPWSRGTYLYEVQRNDRSTMMVLQKGHDPAPDERSWIARLIGRSPSSEHPPLIGYAGFWQIEDEAHISTITVHPEWRGQRLGELLLWKMISLALYNSVDKVTLEVRVSNTVAKALYRKYGFRKVGKRRGYYRDNNEDAHVMMLEPLDDEFLVQFDAFGKALYNRAHIIDLLPHPEHT